MRPAVSPEVELQLELDLAVPVFFPQEVESPYEEIYPAQTGPPLPHYVARTNICPALPRDRADHHFLSHRTSADGVQHWEEWLRTHKRQNLSRLLPLRTETAARQSK